MADIDLSKLAVREQPRPKPKRFYKSATVSADGPPYRVLLDGKPVKTPMRNTLQTPIADLATAVAAEWEGQVDVIAHEAMPLTRLLATAIDRVGPDRKLLIDELLGYVDTDLLCYRATHPADLKQRQAVVWQPVLDWMSATHGISMTVADGVMPIRQPESVVVQLRAVFERYDVLTLTAAQAAAAVTGSLVLASAVAEGRLSGAEAFAAAQLDETYQIENWGVDDEAAARRGNIAFDLDAIGRFAALVRGTPI